MQSELPAEKQGSKTALVVDGNATSRRFVELALERSLAGWSVEAAADAARAFEILNVQQIDLVVCDSDLDGMNGLAFFRRLSKEQRLRTIPFVFLSADRSVGTKVAALRAGVDDYLVKPCDVAELVARAEALVTRGERARQAARSRIASLAGDLSVISFADLVGIIEMGRRTGVLSILTPRSVGRLYFEGGHVVHATYGNLQGEEAFHHLFLAESGNFEFAACSLPTDERTISSSVTALVLESARRFDTEAASVPRPQRNARSTRPPALVALGRAQGREPALEPETLLAAQFELALRDPFSLGDLMAWTESSLSSWTRNVIGTDRLHIHLVADVPSGVSSILGLAGAPTERWVLDSLAEGPKAFGLAFYLRQERVVDLVVLDVKAPTTFLPYLRRTPSITIVCPPDGDLLDLGTNARAALEQLIENTTPTVVVGVGNDALDAQLRAMSVFAGKSGRPAPLLRCTAGELGTASTDLRGLVTKGIRLWAASSARET